MNFDANVNNQLTRNDFAIIIALNRHLADIQPVRLVYTGSDYKAGTVLGRVTASGYYKPYNDANSDGTQVAKGILFEDVLVDDFLAQGPSLTGLAMARCLFAGYVFKDKLTGLDTAGETDLSAKTIIDASGVSILKF